uniref:Integrase family protein n=1 Tax=Cyanothece sp. (strain PCC 7425 / ATCC 29141) TaxID=395961 RepID=B8HJM3_CYAP4
MRFSVGQNNNSYYIRFTLGGKQKNFYPGTKDRIVAESIARKMTLEWELGQFDLTLTRYKCNAIENQANYSPELVEKLAGKKEPRLLELWDKWVDSLKLPDFTKNNHYHCVRQAIIKQSKPPVWDDTSWYLQYKDKWANTTFNQRRHYLRGCINWALEKKLVSGKNPYMNIRAVRSRKPDHVKPFTPEEIHQIIAAFESNQFCPKCSAYLHSHYVPFVRFQFLTGARSGETIALQWKHVDFKSGRIRVEQALGRCLDTSPFATRKSLKETKTGTTGWIPISPALQKVLESVRPLQVDPEAWVFPGQRGGYIDTRRFRKIWKKVLEGLGIEYRYPSQTRHTVLSRVAETQGVEAASKLARHRGTQTAIRHYIRGSGKVELPNFF